MQLNGSLVKVNELSTSDKNRMFELLNNYFINVYFKYFEEDLREKQWVIILRDEINSEIQGFSTQMILKVSMNGSEYKALFSGDTIIERKYWHQTELIRIWGKLALRLIEEYPKDELFWFLISMGYRTYKFLPLFFKEFYPCYNKPMPVSVKNILDAFAYTKYPQEYNAQKGVIRLQGHQMRLKEGISDIRENLLKNLHINYFIKLNPFYYQGDELACIARLSKDNFKPCAFKIINSRG